MLCWYSFLLFQFQDSSLAGSQLPDESQTPTLSSLAHNCPPACTSTNVQTHTSLSSTTLNTSASARETMSRNLASQIEKVALSRCPKNKLDIKSTISVSMHRHLMKCGKIKLSHNETYPICIYDCWKHI